MPSHDERQKAIEQATLDGRRAMRSAAIIAVRQCLRGRRWLPTDLDTLADQVEAAIRALHPEDGPVIDRELHTIKWR